mgnify:CR=1 FL=1
MNGPPVEPLRHKLVDIEKHLRREDAADFAPLPG